MRTLILGIVAAFAFHVQGLGTTDSRPCNINSCNESCIALNWSGGNCESGDCWCWTTEGTYKRVERTLSALKLPSSDAGFCIDSRCNQLCIARHWDGGSCKNGHCWCGKIGESDKPIEKLLTEPNVSASEERLCDTARCVKECGGHCKDEKCWCSKPATVIQNSRWTLLHDLPPNFKDTAGKDVISCTDRTCDDACKKESASSGVCLKSLCWCTMTTEEPLDKRNVRPIIELQAGISDVLTDEDRCHPSVCRRQCSNDNKIGRAACFFGYCWCDNEPQKIHDKQARKRMTMHNQHPNNSTAER